MISYDIWCQYSVNLAKQILKQFPGMMDVLFRIHGTIPKMHINNHIASCKAQWAFNYLPYSGETWGENIEGGWAEQNQSAGSTKEMNDGHRHDTLDDFWGYWNWTKTHRMGNYSLIHCVNCPDLYKGATLKRMYLTCIKTLTTRHQNFEALTALHPEDLIKQWEAMDMKPKKVNGEVLSIYETHVKQGTLPDYRVQCPELTILTFSITVICQNIAIPCSERAGS